MRNATFDRLATVLLSTLIAVALTTIFSVVAPASVRPSPVAATELRTNLTLSAGGGHVCAIGSPGALGCWGLNLDGQLGDGTTEARDVLTVIGSDDDWMSVSAGNRFTCGIRSTSTGMGSLWCWGLNDHGQLGDGTLTTRLAPVQVGSASNWIAVSTGRDHACAINIGGDLYCWGSNAYGQIGNDGDPGVDVPSPVEIGEGTTWSRIGSGYWSTHATDSGGRLWAWGFNDEGQLGDGTLTNRSLPVQIGSATNWAEPVPSRHYEWTPAWWSPTSGFYSCAIKTDNTLWCAGNGYNGNFGNGTYDSSAEFVRAGGDSATYSSASIGDYYMCGVRTNGTLWCWGWNVYGTISPGSTEDFPEPEQIGTASDWTTVAVGPGGDIAADPWYFNGGACAMNVSGEIHCWGSNMVGQQGRGLWARDIGGEWSGVTAGRGFSCGIDSATGAAFCWGTNNYGRMGHGGAADAVSGNPIAIDSTNVTGWQQLFAARYLACGIAASGAAPGSAWCWGSSRSGGLGNGDTSGTLILTPVQVGDASCTGEPGCNADWTWDRISVGVFGACGITSSGELWCWGENQGGVLGNGSSDIDPHPELFQVGSALGGTPTSDWIDIASINTGIAGGLARCGIREVADDAGTLWCWGGGVIGGGNLVPVQVGEDADWSKIVLGSTHACATKNSGTLWCWGQNWHGELGLGTLDAPSVPTRVGTETDWIDIAAGWNVSCGIREEVDPVTLTARTLLCWGDNGFNILGLPSTTSDSTSPVAVAVDFSPEIVSMMEDHACVIGEAAIGCHGSASESQLGTWMAREGLRATFRLPDEAAEPDITPPGVTWSLESSGITDDLTTLSWTLTFDEEITGLDSSDLENALGFTATGCSFLVATADAGAGLIYTVTVTSCGDGTIRPRLKSDAVLDAASNAGPVAAIDGSTTVTYTAPGGGGGGGGGGDEESDGDEKSISAPSACSNNGVLPLIDSEIQKLFPTTPGAAVQASMTLIGKAKRSYIEINEDRLQEGVRHVNVGEFCATEIFASKGRLQFSNSSYVGWEATRAYIWMERTGWRNLAVSTRAVSSLVTLPVINFQTVGHYVIAITNGSGKAGSDAMWGTRHALISVWITTPTFRVSFAPDSSRLTTKGKSTLEKLMNEIARIPGAVGVEVTGYINPLVKYHRMLSGTPLTLAEMRAERVKRYLIKLGLKIPLETLAAQRGQDNRMDRNRKVLIVIHWILGT